MYWSISHVRPAMIAAVLACLCLAVSGCSVADHTAVDLPVKVTDNSPGVYAKIHLPAGDAVVFTRGIGYGGSLFVDIDMQSLPEGVTPDDIGAAALTIPVSSSSLTSGFASFAIYMREPYPSQSSDAGNSVYYSVPDGAEPLCVHELSHDGNRSLTMSYDAKLMQIMNRYTVSSGPDTSTKHMNFDITEAIRAWVGGMPYAGLVVVQQGAIPADGPIWHVLDHPQQGKDGPRAVVWISNSAAALRRAG